MRQIIPFKKNIVLKSKFDTISSLSLEHDYKVSDDEVSGEFLVSGTYRTTEASLIDEDFYEKLPFEISLSDRIITDSVDLKIEDFTYQKSGEDSLTLEISLLLNCDEEEIKEENEEIIEIPFVPTEESKEERLERILESINPLGMDEEERSVKTLETLETQENDDIFEERKTEMHEKLMPVMKENEVEYENTLVKTVGITKENTLSAESISSFVSDKKNYVTYKVYIVHEFDDFNSISAKFNVPLKTLEEYNEIKELNVGDKVIIPYVFD